MIFLYNLNASNVKKNLMSRKTLNEHKKNIHEENVDESLGSFTAKNVMKDRIWREILPTTKRRSIVMKIHLIAPSVMNHLTNSLRRKRKNKVAED